MAGGLFLVAAAVCVLAVLGRAQATREMQLMVYGLLGAGVLIFAITFTMKVAVKWVALSAGRPGPNTALNAK